MTSRIHEYMNNMMILSFVSQKGGSGKTTLSVNFAALAFGHNIPVAIIDLDPQASASAWGAMRGEGIKVEACHPPLLIRTLEFLKNDGCQLVIIDTPPHNSTAAANAIRVSDFVVIPVRPASFDLAAVSDTIELIKANNRNAGFVINSVPPNTTVAESAEKILQESGLKILGYVGQRMNIQHALTAGRGVVEADPKSQSSKEIIDIWNKIVEKVT